MANKYQDLKDLFDGLIKDNLIKAGVNPNDFGYVHTNNKTYNNYYTNQKFNAFTNNMAGNYKAIFDKYSKGQGSELKEKSNQPPKMASVASSSRFCYLGLKDADIAVFPEFIGEKGNGKFKFEEDLPNGLSGTNPQMDAYYEGKNTIFYFEFKCQELLEGHKQPANLSDSYDNLINQIDPQGTANIRGLKTERFDAKQFFTHLSGVIKQDLNKKKVLSFVYFCPNNLPAGLKLVYQELENEINDIFTKPEIMAFCKANNITLNYYRFENDVMDGFENHPGKLKLILSV